MNQNKEHANENNELDTKEMNYQLCDDSDPASYFLGNRKLSEAQAHASFMNQTPNVLNDQKKFINDITKMPDLSKGQPINNAMLNMLQDEPQKNNKKINASIATASMCSEYIPVINHINNKDHDDDNSSNTTKLIDLLVSSLNGSVLATLELSEILAKTKSTSGEVFDTSNCNDHTNYQMCELQSHVN